MPTRNSLLFFFILGAVLLVVPLALIMIWDGPNCATALTSSSGLGFCPSARLFKSLTALFPFLMVIGAVFIGYNLKRISDSSLPKEDLKEEGEETDQM